MIKLSAARKLIMLVIVAFIANCSIAQPGNDSLNHTIRQMDSIFFDAFNKCDTNKSKSLFTKDLEFYHDAGGLTGYAQNLESIRYRCNSQNKVRRELVAGSLEIYPIKNYGAIEIGRHRFYYTAPGKKEELDGTFKFIHIWVYTNNEWQISRVISFDH